MNGKIKGLVTNAETSEPMQAVKITITPSGDTTLTSADGMYLSGNLTPETEYEIQAAKSGYLSSSKKASVEPAETKEVNFSLYPSPIPDVSVTYLDFGLDLTILSFIISNKGYGEFSYIITSSKEEWILVSPSRGDIAEEKDSITVIIDRTGLSDSIYDEIITITSVFGTVLVQNTIHVYVNGLFDPRSNKNYRIVWIGTQLWMAENLNVGENRSAQNNLNNDIIIEKYCYNNLSNNCKIYGGLYTWEEMMKYNQSDTGSTGITQGICPDGWHIPTEKEWDLLINYLGGFSIAGAKLKETGTSHWTLPNEGATNESGFSALPGGYINAGDRSFYWLGGAGFWWSSTDYFYFLKSASKAVDKQSNIGHPYYALSVRCLK